MLSLLQAMLQAHCAALPSGLTQRRHIRRAMAYDRCGQGRRNARLNFLRQSPEHKEMDLRHLRYFIAVAEELNFSRAAYRLHIEQSPLSRAIQELELELGVQLFERNRRGTRLLPAGTALLQDARRLFANLEVARENVRAVASGHSSTLRIAISDGAIDLWLPTLLARCREEEPEVGILLTEMPPSELLHSLRVGDCDVGLARSDEVGDDIVPELLGKDALMVAVPSRHPVLIHKKIPLTEVGRYPLIACHPKIFEGKTRQIDRLLRTLDKDPVIAQRVSSLDLFLTLVAAGYGLGLVPAAQGVMCRHPDVVLRPLDWPDATLATYLLRRDSPISEPLDRFIARARDLASRSCGEEL